MTVLVIIGLMSSAVVMTLPEDKPEIETETQKLTASLNVLAETSLLTGQTSALGVSEDGYQFFTYVEGQWTPKPNNLWMADTSVNLRRDGVKVKLTDTAMPSLIFEPTGLSTPFVLAIDGRDQAYAIRSEGDGKILRERTR